MGPLATLIQFFFDFQARQQTDRLRIAGIRAAEKGRRMAMAGALYTLAGAFVFSGLLIAIIDLGLQIDRGAGVGYSGLMFSATILMFLALVSGFAGWLAGRDPAVMTAIAAAELAGAGIAADGTPLRPRNELRDVLEEIATMFLRDFLEKQKAQRAPQPPPGPAATPEGNPL